MSLISYAQNFEDVILWRALGHVDQGFYVDVGAHDPYVDSVTKAFYDRGWRGINIEPIEFWFGRLQEARPRDINLQLAAGAENGSTAFYEIPGTGLSTSVRAIAERHCAEQGHDFVECCIPVRTLTDICKDYHLAPIHFMKIDVEGAEEAVLAGVDFRVLRPWVVIIESTVPNSRLEDYERWQKYLLQADYEFRYFDGLNRFYLAKEHAELSDALSVPPNVFDDFIRRGEHEAAVRAEHLHERSDELARTMDTFRVEAQGWEVRAKALQGALDASVADAKERCDDLQMRLYRSQDALQFLQANVELRAAEWQVRLTEAEVRAHQAQEEAAHWQRAALILQKSRSWRITAPLRLGKCILSGDLSPLARARSSARDAVTSLLRIPVVFAVRVVLRQPTLRLRARSLLRRFPQLGTRLREIALRLGANAAVGSGTHGATSGFGLSYVDVAPLTASARSALAELKDALAPSASRKD